MYNTVLSVASSQTVNPDYKARLSTLSNLVLVKFLEDTMVQPRESEWFGFYVEGQDKKVFTMNESKLYTEVPRLIFIASILYSFPHRIVLVSSLSMKMVVFISWVHRLITCNSQTSGSMRIYCNTSMSPWAKLISLSLIGHSVVCSSSLCMFVCLCH